MAKDPAVLWYWNDWNGGTSTLSRHLKGCYMDLLSAQFNSGPLSLDQIKIVLGTDQASWTVLLKKFKREVNSENVEVFFNERLESEKLKRGKFTESRRKNLLSTNKIPHMATHMVPHMENENEISIELIKKGITEKENMCYEIEEDLIRNQIQFEKICMAAYVSPIDAKNDLHLFHLYLVKENKYPNNRLALYAGFESWLHRSKNFKKPHNGIKTIAGKSMDYDRP